MSGRSKIQLDTRIQSSSPNMRLFIYITKFTNFHQDCIAANYYRFAVDFRRIPFINLLFRIILTKTYQDELSSNKTKFCKNSLFYWSNRIWTDMLWFRFELKISKEMEKFARKQIWKKKMDLFKPKIRNNRNMKSESEVSNKSTQDMQM